MKFTEFMKWNLIDCGIHAVNGAAIKWTPMNEVNCGTERQAQHEI